MTEGTISQVGGSAQESLDELLERVEDPALRSALRGSMGAAAFDELFVGCEWIGREPDPHRRTPDDVIADVDRVMQALAPHSAVAMHIDLLIAELGRRKRHGFGLVWDAESPDNAERLRIPVKDLAANSSCGMELDEGVIVDHIDSATDLYRIAAMAQEGEVVLQPWEPRTGDLAGEVRKVRRDEISHVVHTPYDESTTVYPMLAHRETIAHSDCLDDAPVHTLIEGENYHALQALLTTHRGKVDVIYIDPPYNTGSQDFSYNDCYVNKDDDFRHSSWLRFMNRRLKMAKKLLSPTGFIAISIDDNEMPKLLNLLEAVFGEGAVKTVAVKMSEAAGVKMSAVNAQGLIPKLKEYVLFAQMGGGARNSP